MCRINLRIDRSKKRNVRKLTCNFISILSFVGNYITYTELHSLDISFILSEALRDTSCHFSPQFESGTSNCASANRLRTRAFFSHVPFHPQKRHTIVKIGDRVVRYQSQKWFEWSGGELSDTAMTGVPKFDESRNPKGDNDRRMSWSVRSLCERSERARTRALTRRCADFRSRRIAQLHPKIQYARFSDSPAYASVIWTWI